VNGDFWTEDDGERKQTKGSLYEIFFSFLEPIPCSMDNWGEGVVPACREEHPQRFIFNGFSILSIMIFI
jgi:hypothetical protein